MSRRPLHKGVASRLSRHPKGHAGLWFDKFCDTWSVVGDKWTLSASGGGANLKLDWIRTVANGNPVGSDKEIGEYVVRLLRLVRARGGQFAVFEAESRFVTGLGRSHPVENGFAWHPTLGTPYLPGSSVKGLVRSWAAADADPRLTQEAVDRVFGAGGAAGPVQGVGAVCFLDAVPLGPVRLDADVMTPHYAGWGPENPPGDWCSPKPIPFLTAAANTRMLVGVVPRSNVHEGDLESVFKWLESALEWSGAGAKTAVGYGRFRRDEKATRDYRDRMEGEDRKRREERERQEAMKSPEDRWRLKLKGMTETQLLEEVRLHLEKHPIEDPQERRAFAEAVRATGYLDYWRRGQAKTRTNVGRKKLKQRARLVQTALTGLAP